jgi:hypothetical protein
MCRGTPGVSLLMFMTQMIEEERRHSDASSNTKVQSPAQTAQRRLLYVTGFNNGPKFDKDCVFDDIRVKTLM